MNRLQQMITMAFPCNHLVVFPSSQNRGALEKRRSKQTLAKTSKYLNFSKHLKTLEKAGVAMRDCIDAECVGDVLRNDVLALLPEHLQASALHHGRLKLDAVTMNIERRECMDLICNRQETIQSVHVYSDASPVTGAELQGMVLEVFLTIGALMTFIMPGCVMHFGQSGAVNRAVAYLWALQLMVCKITSVITDMGVEFKLSDTPNILKAFLRWRMGVPMSLLIGTVDFTSRLFSATLYGSADGHTFL